MTATKTKTTKATKSSAKTTATTRTRKTAAKATRATSRAPVNTMPNRDKACFDLIARDGGATIAEIRVATDWKGVIAKGPARVAKKAGRKLKAEGEGEDRRFSFATK
jgi:hypothetical protein